MSKQSKQTRKDIRTKSTKKFNGKTYRRQTTRERKVVAQGLAEAYRNGGHPARVVKEGKVWVLYVRN